VTEFVATVAHASSRSTEALKAGCKACLTMDARARQDNAQTRHACSCSLYSVLYIATPPWYEIFRTWQWSLLTTSDLLSMWNKTDWHWLPIHCDCLSLLCRPTTLFALFSTSGSCSLFYCLLTFCTSVHSVIIINSISLLQRSIRATVQVNCSQCYIVTVMLGSLFTSTEGCNVFTFVGLFVC